LIIEDNVQNALLVKRILRVRGHEVLHAEEGGIGFETATREIPDLILIDLGLPDIDGQTLIGVIKNEPKLKDVPMIAVTAWPAEVAQAMAKAYGCKDCISKPINTRTFADQIEKYLPKS
jgi:CheY-like chemotaxis protein